MKKGGQDMLRMAIIGAGTWGEAHANIYAAHPNVELIAICDLNKEKADQFARKHDLREKYYDYREMLDRCNCDAVAIVTPDFLHTEIAIACAQAGKHMLIEKPLATKREDVLNIVKTVEKNNVRVMVDLHNRWNPPFNLVKQMVKDGKYGPPKTAYFRLNDALWVATDMLSWTAQTSILWFLGSHSLDTMSWILGSLPDEVFAYKIDGKLKSLGIDAVDAYQTLLKYSNGAIAQMENSWITPNGNSNVNDFKFNAVFDKGKFDIDASSHTLLQLTTEKTFGNPDMLVKNSVFERFTGFAYESIRSFVDKMITGEEFHVSLLEAANVSLAILSIMESAETGKPVRTQLIYNEKEI
jgi:predicted dehydrogenase